MSYRSVCLILTAVLLLPAAPASAQQSPGPATPRPVGRLVLGGVLGGAAGLATGGVIGVAVGANHCTDEGNPDSCHAPQGLVYGAVAGQTISIPLGVHIANSRQGRLLPGMLASAVIAGAGALAISSADNDAVLVGAAIGVPALQIVSSVLIERATTRNRRR
jgi:hypothetical protein